MIRLSGFALDGAERPHAALYDAMDALVDEAERILEEERQDPDSLAAPEVAMPPIGVFDDAGRRITAVRIDRDPHTADFRLILLTEGACPAPATPEEA